MDVRVLQGTVVFTLSGNVTIRLSGIGGMETDDWFMLRLPDSDGYLCYSTARGFFLDSK